MTADTSAAEELPDPTTPPVEYVNAVDLSDPRVEPAPDQSPFYETGA